MYPAGAPWTPAALLKADPPILAACIWTTVGLMVYSFLHYLFRGLALLRQARRASLSQQSTQ